MHDVLTSRYGREDWHLDHRLLRQIPQRLRSELEKVIERARADHAGEASVHHVISGLSLGFWNNFLSNNFRHLLWNAGIGTLFPYADSSETQQSAYQRVEQFREWRNRIFHHNAIFDKRPTAQMQNIDTLLGWRCKDTQWLVRYESNVSLIINSRPRL